MRAMFRPRPRLVVGWAAFLLAASSSAMSGEPPQVNGPPMTGAPCDVGWCASVVPTELSVGLSTSSGPYNEHTAMKVGAGELVHMARAQDLISFDYVTVNPTSIVSSAVIDPETWGQFTQSPPPDEGGGWLSIGNPMGPVIGVDPRPGQHHVYVAYASVEPQFFGPQLSGPRFGVVVGESPGFEDLPAGWDPITDIQVDENGAAIVLQKGSVYRYVTGGTWDQVAVPCSITAATGLAIDTENAVWYLMSSDNTLYRRDATDAWTKTPSPGGKVVLAGGTVHLVSGQSVVHRVGTQWSQPLVPPFGDTLGTTPVKVAIDSCWAPHAAVAYMYDTNFLFEIDYTRWTSRGFLTLRRVSNDYPGVELAITPGHVFVHGGGGIFVLPAHWGFAALAPPYAPGSPTATSDYEYGPFSRLRKMFDNAGTATGYWITGERANRGWPYAQSRASSPIQPGARPTIEKCGK